MEKYNTDLIIKYITGDDIDNYSIVDLENDKDFMISVIDYTNDSRIYSLCSDELKVNFEFVKYLVLKFANKKEFISNVSEYFFNNAKIRKSIELIELSIIMERLLSKYEEYNFEYKLRNITQYRTDRMAICTSVNSLDKQIEKDFFQNGFWIIYDMYNSSDYIMEYYAEHYLNDIFERDDFSLEKYLHNKYDSSNTIIEMGINTCILNLISSYDKMLGDYVSNHLKLIEYLTKRINRIIKNWDNYIKYDENERYNNMFEMVYEYLENTKCNIGLVSMLYYVSKELGVYEKVKNNFEISELFSILSEINDLYEEDLTNEEDFVIKRKIENELYNSIAYNNVKKIMQDQLLSEEPLELHEIIPNYRGRKKDKCKIIDINKNKSTN